MARKSTHDSPLDKNMQLAEIHHRLKNCISTVQAIVEFSNNVDSVEEFKKKVSGRIMAYGRAQDLLIESRWESASLMQLMEVMLAPFNGQAHVHRFRMSGDDAVVPPKVAELLCFATNELATNSAKYGALSKRGGYVEIHWCTEADPARLTFHWQDVDGPPVKPPLQRGFGSNFIERYTKNLRGTLKMSYDPKGAACTICVPL